MKPLVTFAIKALRVGPLPYLGLSVAIVGVGALLQLRSGSAQNLQDGRTIFGVFAQIGGCVGLFGLATLMFVGLPAGSRPGTAGGDVPQRQRDARMARPQPESPATARSRLPDLARLAQSPAARAGLRFARQIGTRAIRQLARKGRGTRT